MKNSIYETQHMYVTKVKHSGLVRYWVTYRDRLGSYGCYADKDYAIEMCNYLEEIENWDEMEG